MISKETCEKIAKKAKATIIFQMSGNQSMVFVYGNGLDLLKGTELIIEHTFEASEVEQ